MMKAESTIAIIGAGLAGLTVAHRLRQRGFSVDVYEGRERVGGRVLSACVEGHVAELGAQSIGDGGEARHLLGLAEELGLKVATRGWPEHISYFEGGKVTPLPRGSFNPPSGCATMEEVLDALFDRKDVLHKLCAAFLFAIEGSPPHLLSSGCMETLALLLQGKRFQHKSIEGGNSRLAEALGKELSIHFGHTLTAVNNTSDGKYRLTFHNGRVVTSDLLVLTLPCSVYSDVEFAESVIPKTQVEAIQTIQFGTNSKILAPITPPVSGTFTNGRLTTFPSADQHTLNLFYLAPWTDLDETYTQDLPFIKATHTLANHKMPTLATDTPFDSYTTPVAYNWPSDPFTKGSYSCMGAHKEPTFTQFNGETVNALFAPRANTLFFAGEHTTILPNCEGTMEAAVESGERTARLITSHSIAHKTDHS